jgi:RNA polymerase sigma-70 factor, ECF subfamily
LSVVSSCCPDLDDQQLIARIKGGDGRSFDVLVKRYQDRINNLCRYMLENRQDAEDAAQDTFLKAYRNLNAYRPSASFYTWLYRVAVNTCLDHKRKISLRSLWFLSDNEDRADSFPSNIPSPEAAYSNKQSMQSLRSALNKLSKKLRVVIVLKELDRLSYEEIAEILEVSVGTVKSRISRAREELQKNIEKNENFTEQIRTRNV